MKKIDTYRKLRDALNSLSESELDMNLTIVDHVNEYIPVKFRLGKEEEDDVLDKGHPIIYLLHYELNHA